MKKTLIYLPEELHEGLRHISFQTRKSISRLVREAIEQVYTDELDAIDMERELEEYALDPSSAMSWEEFKATVKRGIPA